jgi:superfamily II DNA or RNA helicase
VAKDVDRLADQSGDSVSTGDRLKETFLDVRPPSQWPPYLDEIATDVTAGIGIGDTQLDRFNFPREVGPLYSEGLLATAEGHSDLPTAIQYLGEADIGRAAFLLNRLRYEIRRSDSELEDVQRAVSAVLEMILSEISIDFTTPNLRTQSNSTADVLMQLLSRADLVGEVDSVLEAFEEAYHDGLLATLDYPQMTTPLWTHQREAISRWLDAGGRGYVDMATATGKTVLGLAAIAARYGSLHPTDASLLDIDRPNDTADRRADVLIVAHNELILEQWRREFDRHLSIPPDRTQGSDDITLTWGTVHFRTAQTLMNQDVVDYDLVLLDEAHHYANGSGWGELLETFDDDVLALSGSVDTDSETSSALRQRLESVVGEECKRYTLAQARDDGIIPTFEWAVHYAKPDGSGDSFAEITERAESKFEEFQHELETADSDVATDRRLDTFTDVLNYSHTSEGESLKQTNTEFRDLATTLFSRRAQGWNQSPSTADVVAVLEQHLDRNVVVLTNNNAQVDVIVDELSGRSDVDEDQVYAVKRNQSSEEQRNVVDAFDDPADPAVLVGTGDLLGEGVDMHHADVGINMATGSVNKQLIQRIGRVLRNPGTGKRARFVNLVGVPVERETQFAPEDGQQLIEDALLFKRFGQSFDNHPEFAVAERTDDSGVGRLLDGGYERITTLDEDGLYEWPERDTHREMLEYLLQAVDDHPDVESVLRAWGPGEQESSPRSDRDDDTTVTVTLEILGRDGDPVEGAFVSFVGETVALHDRTDRRGRVQFEAISEPCTAGIQTPAGDTRTVEVDPAAESTGVRSLRVPSSTDTEPETDG